MSTLAYWACLLPLIVGCDLAVWKILAAPWRAEMHPVLAPTLVAAAPDYSLDIQGLT